MFDCFILNFGCGFALFQKVKTIDTTVHTQKGHPHTWHARQYTLHCTHAQTPKRTILHIHTYTHACSTDSVSKRKSSWQHNGVEHVSYVCMCVCCVLCAVCVCKCVWVVVVCAPSVLCVFVCSDWVYCVCLKRTWRSRQSQNINFTTAHVYVLRAKKNRQILNECCVVQWNNHLILKKHCCSLNSHRAISELHWYPELRPSQAIRERYTNTDQHPHLSDTCGPNWFMPLRCPALHWDDTIE